VVQLFTKSSIDSGSDGLEYLMDNQPDISENMTKFMDYFVENWIENSNFPIKLWNPYANMEDPRTNNRIEGYHRRLDRLVYNKKPNIWVFIEHIHGEETSFSAEYLRLLNGKLKGNNRTKENLDKDLKILQHRCVYLEDNGLKNICRG
jgi:hypothetical protein